MKHLSKTTAVLLWGIFLLFIFAKGAYSFNGDFGDGTDGFGDVNVICELKVDKAGEDEDNDTVASLSKQRVIKSLHFETYNTNPGLLDIWLSLFGVTPDTNLNDIVTLQGPDRILTWAPGILEMGGVMKIKVKTDKKTPGLKEVKIENAGKNKGTTVFVSGTGGVNPNVDNTGWHAVKIKKMDNVTVYFDGNVITGFLKELVVKLDEGGSTAAREVKEFKLKIKGPTSVSDVKKGTVSSVVVEVPETVIIALAGTEYEEKIKDHPKALLGHTEAEYERASDALAEAADISTLIDGNNDQLKERKGQCTVMEGIIIDLL